MLEPSNLITRGQAAATDVTALLRARNPLLWVVTREEGRAEKLLFEAAAGARYLMHTWDIAAGATEFGSGKTTPSLPQINGIEDMLQAIQNRATSQSREETRDLWVLRDAPGWLAGPMGLRPLRQLRNLARLLPGVVRDKAQAIVILTSDPKVPEELSGHATVIEWPLPDRMEIAAILDAAINRLPDDIKAGAAPNGTREAAIDAAVGLTEEEAAACYAKSLVQNRRIDPMTVAQEKKRVIARERVLEWYDPLPGGLDAVGGLENLKEWLNKRRGAYTKEARAYGLPSPKGVFLVGHSGCGKSLTAKAICTAWGIPLLRFDLGAMLGKYMGESQSNIRKAQRVIEAIGRCGVWFDEIEKALAAGTEGAASDGGVGADQLGTLLSWMQERKGEAFIIATANDVSKLPPELLRKGRFDEMFFVDLPNDIERVEVLGAALRANNRGGVEIDRAAVAAACRDFTGAEIAAIVPDAMYAAYADDAREIATADLIAAAKTVTPLAVTAKEKIDFLRDWAKTRARPASKSIQDAAAIASTSQLDF